MKVRQHRRLWSAVLLIVQSAWLFAIVPADCCAAHAPAATDRSCHEEVQATHCPMKDSTGAACPMHRAGHEHGATDDCRLSGGCKGPMSALLALLSVQAVLDTSTLTLTTASAPAQPLDPREQLVTRYIPPDSPPPRV